MTDEGRNDIGGVAADRLRSFVQRIERLEEERTALGADIREVYSEAKSAGFDVKTLRQIVKLLKIDRADRQEQEALLDLYKRALDIDDAAPRLPMGDDPDTSKITGKDVADTFRSTISDNLAAAGVDGRSFADQVADRVEEVFKDQPGVTVQRNAVVTSRHRKAAKNLMETAAAQPGDSFSITGPDGKGVKVTNRAGKHVVEPVAGQPSRLLTPPGKFDPDTGEIIEDTNYPVLPRFDGGRPLEPAAPADSPDGDANSRTEAPGAAEEDPGHALGATEGSENPVVGDDPASRDKGTLSPGEEARTTAVDSPGPAADDLLDIPATFRRRKIEAEAGDAIAEAFGVGAG